MSYSGTRLAVGVVVGMAAFALAFTDRASVQAAAAIVLVSLLLMAQVPKRGRADEPAEPAISDRERWREAGRELITWPAGEVRALLVQLLMGLAAIALWSVAERRYPALLKSYGELLLLIVFAALWLRAAVRSYRAWRRHHLTR